MTDDKKPDQPREWWIQFAGHPLRYDCMEERLVAPEEFTPSFPHFDLIHVIEKSAYDALQKRCEELEEQLKLEVRLKWEQHEKLAAVKAELEGKLKIE